VTKKRENSGWDGGNGKIGNGVEGLEVEGLVKRVWRIWKWWNVRWRIKNHPFLLFED
jgi:hypothetical protein